MSECNICNDDYGYKYCKCNFLICKDCLDKIKDYKCPQCNISMKKNYFFAGKILNYETDEMHNEGFMPHYNRIIVAHEDDISWISYQKRGGIDVKLIISYEDYKNLSIPIKAQLSTYNIVGPCAILNDKNKDFSHGHWPEDYLLSDITNMSNIVIERNDEMIKSCDIFSLKIPEDLDCFKSFSEWGQAKALNKTLIIFGNLTDELYLFCQESIDSFQKLCYMKRDPIIFNHPELPFKTYSEYKKSLMKIINERKIKYCFSSSSDNDSD